MSNDTGGPPQSRAGCWKRPVTSLSQQDEWRSQNLKMLTAKCFNGKWKRSSRTSFCCLFNLFLSVRQGCLHATHAKFPNWVLTKAVIIQGWDFGWRNALTGPILWLFICNSIINSALPRLKTDPWWQKVENVKICEILIKLRQTGHCPQICKKLMMMSQFYKYKLKYRKKLSLYYTHDIFSSLDETFCGSTQNCPLWVTISVRKKFFILCGIITLSVDKFLEIKLGERHPYAFFLRFARHMIYVKERIGLTSPVRQSEDIMMVVRLI